MRPLREMTLDMRQRHACMQKNAFTNQLISQNIIRNRGRVISMIVRGHYCCPEGNGSPCTAITTDLIW